ncbi:MAG: 5-carboxymethyl-2-hydroxymuconate Delta-isomerase [Pseudomonadota bacterium]|jgi:5-carboxymethyl-2-hydroxymuconate isomerase
MPHLVILYTAQLDQEADLSALCRQLADAMLAVRDDDDRPVFPTGGVRVLAYPAAHHAVADGGAAARARGLREDYGFVYLNLRMGHGRSAAVHARVGERLKAVTHAFFAPLMARLPLGVTLQIDEGREVFDDKHSSLHPLFRKD